MASRRAFTLMEVLVAVAIAGLVIAAGFRLIGLSLRSLAEVRLERELVVAARRIWLEFRTKEDMPDKGEKDGVSWESELDSVPVVGDMELPFRRVRVTLRGRSMVLYLPQQGR